MNKLKEFVFDKKKIKLKKVIKPHQIAQYAKKLSSNKKDAPIIISGYPGEGKSVLAREIGKAFDRRYNDDRNCIYKRAEFLEKIERFPPSAFIIDEAINLLYKRDWNSGGQKELIKVMNICRSKRHLNIFVQPQFSDMDKDIRNSRIRLWIFVITRGIAVVMKPERSLGGSDDVWNLVENNKIVKQYINKYGQILGTIESLSRTKNFLTFLRWEDIPKEEYDAYEEIKDRKKYEDVGEKDILLNASQVKKERLMAVSDTIAILRANGKLKTGSIGIAAAYLNVSNTSLSAQLKRSRIRLGIVKEKEAEIKMELNKDDRIII
jgi:hypothetical protein